MFPSVRWAGAHSSRSFARVGDDGTRPDIADYHDYLSTQSIFGSSRLTIDTSLDYDELVNDFFAQRLEASGKSIVAAMIHMDIDRILHIWPEARFIHLIRDPRDVCLSCFMQAFVFCGAFYCWGAKRPRVYIFSGQINCPTKKLF